MRIIVTGACGFIGSHTVERLILAGHQVVGIDSFDTYLYPADQKRANAAKLHAFQSFSLIEGSICNPAIVERAISSEVDVVCHMAALAGVRPSLAEPQRYLETNVVGTGVIVERMRALGLKRLVFASSSSVYGVASGAAFDERSPCVTPASPYAATKRMNELQLSVYRDLYQIGVYALRFFTVYGPRQRPDMAISKFMTAIASGKPITLFGDGSSRRDYTFVDDIISGVVAAIETVKPNEFEIFNLGGAATIPLRGLVELIERVVGCVANIEWEPMQPGDVPNTHANIARARAALGFDPKTRLEVGLARQWEWARQLRPIP